MVKPLDLSCIETQNFASLHRLRWACRRGMLELDLILKDFLDNDLNDNNQAKFEQLLNCTDAELADWLLTGKMPPADFQQIIADIKKHAHRII